MGVAEFFGRLAECIFGAPAIMGDPHGPLAWGRKVDPAFRAKLRAIAARLGVEPDALMAVMAFETGRTFDPAIRNPTTSATGLIQFMPKTAAALGTSTGALARMSAAAQLDYVEAYLKPYAGRLAEVSDLYMAVLWPKAIGRASSHVLFAEPSAAYRANRSLDANRDGRITKAEAAARVVALLAEGRKPRWAA